MRRSDLNSISERPGLLCCILEYYSLAPVVSAFLSPDFISYLSICAENMFAQSTKEKEGGSWFGLSPKCMARDGGGDAIQVAFRSETKPIHTF